MGSGSTEDLTLYKRQIVRIYNPSGQFLDVWNDAPLLTGFKEIINGATTPIAVNLPRKLDAFDSPGQANSRGTIAIGNSVEYRLYGPGLPQTGKVRFLGTIEKYEPSIDASTGAESVAVTITPYSAALGDRYITTEVAFGRSSVSTKLKTALTNGTVYTQIAVSKLSQPLLAGDTPILKSGSHTQTLTVAQDASIGDTSVSVNSFTANFSYPTTTTVTLDFSGTYVDPIDMFNYFFNTVDTSTGLGRTYTYPLTLDPSNPASSGNALQYTFKVQPLISAFEKIRLMLPGLNWFYRPNLDNTTTLNQAPTTPQHVFYLGQHFSNVKYSQDITNLKNVAVIQGSGSDVIGNAIGSDLTLYGQRVVAKADSRITDNITASVVAQGYLNFFDQVATRAPIRIFDYRGDYNTGLGYDIESIQVGDTIEIIDTTGVNLATLWDNFLWDNAAWDFSAGAIFNNVVTIIELDYGYDYCDIQIGSARPNYSRALTEILRDLSDYTLG